MRCLRTLQIRSFIHSDHFAVLVFVPHNTEYNTVLFQVIFPNSGGKSAGNVVEWGGYSLYRGFCFVVKSLVYGR